MKNAFKTIGYVSFGILMLGTTALVFWLTQPTTNIEFELVGKPFYDDFDPANAYSLQVTQLAPETGDVQQFQVENRDGLWVIPTHDDYPAEAAERLAKTTTALIGLKRDALQARLESEHGTYRVVDPLGDEVGSPDETGQRITIKGADGNIVVDYIVGEPVKNNDAISFERRDENTQYFYVRRPDEQQTFKVAMNIDLSTKFTDWIEKDFLKLNADDLNRLIIDNYKVEQKTIGGFVRPELVEGETFVVNRENGSAWELNGIDEKFEKTNVAKIDEISEIVDNMEIVGVRPKLQLGDRQILKPDLTLNLDGLGNIPKRTVDQILMQAASDLMEQGFFLNTAQGVPEDQRLFSKLGKIQAGTTEGVNYTIYFGDISVAEKDSIENSQLQNQSTENQVSNSANEDNAANNNKSRFVMVRVTFDESLLGDAPTKPNPPNEPEKPDDYVPSTDFEKKFTAKEGSDSAPPKPPGYAEKLKKFQDYEAALALFIQGQQTYETELENYRSAVKERAKITKRGESKVDELNERFGAWYYVVKASKTDTMRLEREELVVRQDPDPADNPGLPNIPNIDFPPTVPDSVPKNADK